MLLPNIIFYIRDYLLLVPCLQRSSLESISYQILVHHYQQGSEKIYDASNRPPSSLQGNLAPHFRLLLLACLPVKSCPKIISIPLNTQMEHWKMVCYDNMV